MKSIIFFLLFFTVVLCNSAICQSNKTSTGYQFLISTRDYTPFNFQRLFSEKGDEYKTVYKIFHPGTGEHIITIIATHFKSEKEIEIKVEDTEGSIFSTIRTEKANYENPSLEPFGIRGTIGDLGGNKIPNKLMVKFVSEKYENIKVMEVLGMLYGGEAEFYILDK